MKLKIISDGTPEHTKVVDEDTDRELKGVTSIEWSLKPRKRGGGGGGWECICRLVMEDMPFEIVNDEIKRYELRNYATMADDPEVINEESREQLEEVLNAEQLERVIAIFDRQSRKKLSDVTDEERERVRENVPEFPTHRRET